MTIPRREIVALLLQVSLSMAALAQSPPIPRPDLSQTEPRVRAKVEEAERQLEAAASAETWGEYGIVLDAHRLTAEAIVAYREAQRLAPRDFRWSYQLAYLLEFQNPAAAVEAYEQAIGIDPSYAPAQIRLGQTYEKLGRTDEALAAFRRALALDDRDAMAHFGVGRLYLETGELQKAVEHLEKADALSPNVQAIVATLARALYRSGERDRAAALALRAPELPRTTHHRDPRRAAVRAAAVDTESYLERARVLADVGDLDGAVREVRRLLALEPELARAHFLAASLFDRAGQFEAARRAAAEAVRLDPDLDGARAVLAGSLLKLGRFDGASREAARVLAREPNNVHMHLVSALIAAQQGDVRALVDHLDQAYAVGTSDPDLRRLLLQLLHDLALSFADIGNRAEASRRMRQVVELARQGGLPVPVIEGYERELEGLSQR